MTNTDVFYSLAESCEYEKRDWRACFHTFSSDCRCCCFLYLWLTSPLPSWTASFFTWPSPRWMEIRCLRGSASSSPNRSVSSLVDVMYGSLFFSCYHLCFCLGCGLGRLSAESLHPTRSTAQGSPVHQLPSAAIGPHVRLRVRSLRLHENGVPSDHPPAAAVTPHGHTQADRAEISWCFRWRTLITQLFLNFQIPEGRF